MSDEERKIIGEFAARNYRVISQQEAERGCPSRVGALSSWVYFESFKATRVDGFCKAVKRLPGESVTSALSRLLAVVDEAEASAIDRALRGRADDTARLSLQIERLCSLAVHGEEPPGFNAADQ